MIGQKELESEPRTWILGTVGAEMSCSAWFQIASSVLPALLTCATVFIALASTSREFRHEIDAMSVGYAKAGWTKILVTGAVQIWLRAFVNIFGRKLVCWQYLIYTPLYTVAVSVILIGLWLGLVYGAFYANHSFNTPAHIQLWMWESLRQYMDFGIFIAIALDYLTVLLTKVALRSLYRKHFAPAYFAIFSAICAVTVYAIFDVVIYGLHLWDYYDIYTNFVPNDPLPPLPAFKLFPVQPHFGAQLFAPTTFIHVTSRGWISAYFFPEPLLFYAMITTVCTLPFITGSLFLLQIIDWARRGVRSFYKTLSPRFAWKNIVWSILLTLIIEAGVAVWSLATISGHCRPTG
jgi:hypothetical protein